MKKLSHPNITPPGGWRFVDPNTRYFYGQRYRTFDRLITHIKNYRAQNGLDPIPKLRTVVECWLCEQPGMERHCREQPVERTAQQYIQGAKAAAGMVTSKIGEMLGIALSPYVSQAVAEKRAATCVRCKYNLENKEHSRLGKYTDAAVALIVGARKTSQDSKLFSCEVCTCPLRSKVHVSDKMVADHMNPGERYRFPNGSPGLNGKPLYCWQVKPIAEEENSDGQNQIKEQ